MRDNSELFKKLASAEEKFFSSHFLSPVLRDKPVRVRIAGIVMNLKVTKPRNFEGWGIFAPSSMKEGKYEARKIRTPSLIEKQNYFALFPCVRLILCRKESEKWFGIPAHKDSKIKVGLTQINLPEEVQIFETVKTRFDGANFWFEGQDNRSNPRIAPYLRESLTNLLEPDKLELSGLTQEQKDGYEIAYGPALEADIEAKKDKQEERIKSALQRAGAVYRSYIERGDTYTVEYSVDGQPYRSVVNKQNLDVQSAGICLSGGDAAFDLQSLVSVVREGQNIHAIHRYDNVDDYEDY